MKDLLKSIIQKMIGWYVAPIAIQSQKNQQQLEQLRAEYLSFITSIQNQQNICQTVLAEHKNWAQEQFVKQEEKFSEIADREQWTRDRFTEQEEKFLGIVEHEQWTRDRFAEQEEKFSGIAEREQWTRDRFAEQEEKFSGIIEREQWTRQRFAEQEEKFTGIAEREEWTRHRFEEIESHINSSCVSNSDGKLSFAQSGEDMIISYILHFLQKPMSEVTYLDLGANHAKELSNTYHFYQMGANGVLLEANPELIPELEQVRPRDIVLNRAVSLSPKEQEVPFYVLNGDGLSTIDYEEVKRACAQNPDLRITATYQIKTIQVQEILQTYFPQELTILSIDLEGIEEKILEQIDFKRYKPWIIILENIPYRATLSIDEREYKGCSLLEKCGYTEYAFTGINSIFLSRDIVEQFNQKRRKELQGEH